MVIRAVSSGRSLFSDLNRHSDAIEFFTIDAATCVLGSQFIILAGVFYFSVGVFFIMVGGYDIGAIR
jgi:hypothetical protein